MCSLGIWHGEAVDQLLGGLVDRRRVGELGEDDEPDVEERLVADDGSVDHPEQVINPLRQSRAIARAGKVGLAGGGVIAFDLGHFRCRVGRARVDGRSTRFLGVLPCPVPLVAGEEERGEGGVGLAVGVVEPEEDVGGAPGPAGEEPLGAQDQPGIPVIGMRLDVRLELGEQAEELGGLAVDRLDVGGVQDPAGLGGLGVAEAVGRLGEPAADHRDLRQPEIGAARSGAASRAWA